jgi:hypothetical protein
MQFKVLLVEMALRFRVLVRVAVAVAVAQEQVQLALMLAVTVVMVCKAHRMLLLMAVLDREGLRLQGTFLAAAAEEVITMRLPEQVAMVAAVMEELLLMQRGPLVAQILAGVVAAVETTLLQHLAAQAVPASSSSK